MSADFAAAAGRETGAEVFAPAREPVPAAAKNR